MLPMAPIAAPFGIKAAFGAGAPMSMHHVATSLSTSYKPFDWGSLMYPWDKRTQFQKDAEAFARGIAELDRGINQFSAIDRIVAKIVDSTADTLSAASELVASEILPDQSNPPTDMGEPPHVAEPTASINSRGSGGLA